MTLPRFPHAKQVNEFVALRIEKDGFRSSCPGNLHRPPPRAFSVNPKAKATDLIGMCLIDSRSNETSLELPTDARFRAVLIGAFLGPIREAIESINPLN
jgi:hypothetical protein